MSFEVGTVLNQYAITGKIGEGGMGAVYSASDTQLGRDVALKVLPADLAADEERLRRFEREARAVAALNHPNVVTLYSVERCDDTRFLTMELVDGVPLSSVVGSEGLPVKSFFRLALPLVEGVAAAHARGITHRDLKPTNIMVDRESRVKVLDFGLAKLAQGEGAALQLSETNLITDVNTATGQIVGTVAYMSPEQAEGKPVDTRSDIFSLGVVLYEMVTGEAPFGGDSPMSVLSAILRSEPRPVASFRPGLHRQFQRIIDRCLAKDPARRFQTVLDLRNALDALRDELRADELRSDELSFMAPVGTEAATVPAPSRWPGPVAAVALLALGAAFGTGAMAWLAEPPTAVVPRVAEDTAAWEMVPLLVSQDSMPATPTFSPDDAWLVYSADIAGQGDLWRVPASGGQPENLTSSPASEMHPTYSPSGTQIAYTVEADGGQSIHLMPAAGGNGIKVIAEASRPVWSPAGDMIAFVRRGAVWVASGTDYSDTWPTTRFLNDPLDPVWSPDGQSLLVWSEVDLDIVRVPLSGATREPLELVPPGEQVASLAMSADATSLVMARGQYGGHMDLWHIGFDPQTGDVVGTQKRLTHALTDDRDVAISSDGARIAFLARTVERHLHEVRLGADGLAGSAPRKLTSTASLNYYPTLSQDGQRVTWTAHMIAGWLFSMDLDSGVEEKVTSDWSREVREINPSFAGSALEVVFSSTVGGAYHLRQSRCPQCPDLALTTHDGPGADYYPTVSPDGTLIAFCSTRRESEDIWMVAADGGRLRQLTELPGAERYPSWGPNARSVYFQSLQGRDGDIWAVDLDGSNLRPIVERPGNQSWSLWSADGSRLYFVSDETGAHEIWMMDQTGRFQQVTSLGTSRGGLPSVDMFTKFALGAEKLIVPAESMTGEIWVLERGVEQ